jgi:hypothetical protein
MSPVSLDQAKRLSRYITIFEKANKHLTSTEVEKIRLIGIKSLYLSFIVSRIIHTNQQVSNICFGAC